MLHEIDHVQLPVPDTSVAIDWYTTHLDLTLESQHGQSHAVMKLESGPTLFLGQTGDTTVATFTVNRQPYPTIGARVSDIAALRGRLAAAGTPITVFQDEGFGMVMKFYDPFGNMWVVYEPHKVLPSVAG